MGIWQSYCDMKTRAQDLNEENLALHRELAEVRLQLGQVTQQWESQRTIARLATEERAKLAAENERFTKAYKMLGECMQDMIVGNQAAWIEWQHGKGAEAAMSWVHNGLWGPGHIPDEDEPWGKEAQAFYDANCAHPLPKCFCGRPSNILAQGKGYCSNEHYGTGKGDD